MNLICHSSNITTHYDSLLPSILAHFLQLINLVSNNSPNRGSLHCHGEGCTLFSCRRRSACHGLAKGHCCPSSPEFAERGQPEKTHLERNGESSIPVSNTCSIQTVSLGAGKGWLAIAAATEGEQILVLCTAELSSTRLERGG